MKKKEILAMITAAMRNPNGVDVRTLRRDLKTQRNTFRESALAERDYAMTVDTFLRSNPQAHDYAAQVDNYNQAIENSQRYQKISETSGNQRNIIAKLSSEKPEITDTSAGLIRAFNPQQQGESLGDYANRLAGANDFPDSDNMNYKNIAKVAQVTPEAVLTAADTGNGTLEFGH